MSVRRKIILGLIIGVVLAGIAAFGYAVKTGKVKIWAETGEEDISITVPAPKDAKWVIIKMPLDSVPNQ